MGPVNLIVLVQTDGVETKFDDQKFREFPYFDGNLGTPFGCTIKIVSEIFQVDSKF